MGENERGRARAEHRWEAIEAVLERIDLDPGDQVCPSRNERIQSRGHLAEGPSAKGGGGCSRRGAVVRQRESNVLPLTTPPPRCP